MNPPDRQPPPVRLRQRLAHLPRETRDTFFLLTAIAASVLPHAGHLPAWCSALTLLILGWRGWLAWRSDTLPGRWSLGLMLLLVAGLTLATHRTLLGREAGVTMLVMLMAMKTLELRARRDAFVVFFLGFFLVLTQYLYSQSLLTALWTLLSVWALLTALVLAQMPVGQPSLRLAAAQAARTTLLGLPLMVLLFALFPRLPPLWGVPADAVGRTGLSSELQFGAMAEIANDDSIALRLRFASGSPLPPPSALYFRGPVLSRFDGRVWRPQPAARPGMAAVLAQANVAATRGLAPEPLSPALRYEMTLEPLRLSVLPLLEISPEPAGADWLQDGLHLRRGEALQWLAERPITERLRLQQQAHLRYRYGAQATAAQLQAELELPPGRNPRTLAWAAALRREPRFAALQGPALAQALAQAVLEHLRQSDFVYTLTPGRYGEVSEHLIDEFWLDRRLGFCEHFASAFVVVMRALGIPARIVTGFQGADRELQDGYLVVRQSQAHAWTEVWIGGQGWLRIDPTAAVAPERVRLGSALTPPPGVLAGALGQVNPALWQGLRRAWEQLDNRWQQWVLNYSRTDQFELLRRLGWPQPDWQALGQLSAAVIAALALAAAAWAGWQARPHDAWTRRRQWLVRELQNLGIPAQLHQGPRQWAYLLDIGFGDSARELMTLLLHMEQQRYSNNSMPVHGSAFAGLEELRWRQAWRRQSRMLRPIVSSISRPE